MDGRQVKATIYHHKCGITYIYSTMGIFKGGKVVIMLAGRFAGRKAVVVKATDDGNGDKRFGHAVG